MINLEISKALALVIGYETAIAYGSQIDQLKERDAQAAMFIGQHKFSEWNRIQEKPPIPGSKEYFVFENAVRIYLEAINAKRTV